MKVLVIGASGVTGGYALQQLLARGDEVTAMARDVASFPVQHERLRVVAGEARDADSFHRAVEGQDAVFSAFGPRSMKKDDIQEVFMRNLVAAMEKAGVRRLSNLSAWGTGDSFPSLIWPARIILRAFADDFFRDKERGEVHLFASGLDYVNARPGRLTNGPARGGLKAQLDAKGLRVFPLVTREDTATWMVQQLTDPTWVRTSPLLAY